MTSRVEATLQCSGAEAQGAWQNRSGPAAAGPAQQHGAARAGLRWLARRHAPSSFYLGSAWQHTTTPCLLTSCCASAAGAGCKELRVRHACRRERGGTHCARMPALSPAAPPAGRHLARPPLSTSDPAGSFKTTVERRWQPRARRRRKRAAGGVAGGTQQGTWPAAHPRPRLARLEGRAPQRHHNVLAPRERHQPGQAVRKVNGQVQQPQLQ